MAKWKYLYCFFSKSHVNDVLKNGIKPSRLYGGNVVPVYPSRSQVERAIQNRDSNALVMIESGKLDPARLVKVDYNHMFYRGSISPEAIKLVNSQKSLSYNPNQKKSLKDIHNASLNLRGKFDVTGSGIFKKGRRL